MLEQRENIAESERERGELRAEVERLQQRVASLTSPSELHFISSHFHSFPFECVHKRYSKSNIRVI